MITLRDIIPDGNGFAQITFSTFGKPDIKTDYLGLDRAEELFEALRNSERCYEAKMNSWKYNDKLGKYCDTYWMKEFRFPVLEMWGSLVKINVDYKEE